MDRARDQLLARAALAVDRDRHVAGQPRVRFAALMHDLGKGTTPPAEWPKHVGHEERGARLIGALADRLRGDDITLPSALRWVRRRVAPVRKLLTIVVGLLPQWLQGCVPQIVAVRERLGCEEALMLLRALAAVQLPSLSRPLGFLPPLALSGERKPAHQHHMGPDPPAGFG